MSKNLMLFALVASATCVCVPALASEANGSPGARNPEGEIVCKRESRTNSRFQTKVCNSRKQWEQIEEASKRSAREMIDRPVIETRKD